MNLLINEFVIKCVSIMIKCLKGQPTLLFFKAFTMSESILLKSN